jgi:hypothetical protein
MKATSKMPATEKSVTIVVAVLQQQLEKLVELIGDENDAFGNEAVHALYSLYELVAKPLAAAIIRPGNRTHRLKTIFLARLVVPRHSLDIQKALYEVSQQLEDERVTSSAAIILTELIGDELDRNLPAMHWTKRTSETLDPGLKALMARLQEVLGSSRSPAQGRGDHGPELADGHMSGEQEHGSTGVRPT